MELLIQNSFSSTRGWQQHGNVFFIGYANYKGQKLNLEVLEKALTSAGDDLISLKSILNSLNGCFAIVFKKNDFTVVAVDLSRSIPILFSKEQIYTLGNEAVYANNEIDVEQVDGLRNVEFVQNDATFLKGLKQLQAGEFLISKNADLTIHHYFSHNRSEKSISFDAAKTEFKKICDALGEKLISDLEGRKALIPLSGGYDSRFILALLVDKGYENILAFTYGQKTGYEAEIAHEVCERLNIPWAFIDYDETLFSKLDKAEFESYCRYASFGTSVPQEQEYFAIKKLVEIGLDERTVFLPGFCGDVQAGSFIPDKFYEQRWVKNPITAKSYIEENLTRKAQIDLNTKTKGESFFEFYAQLEEWTLRERESKYIINGVRAYEFFGFEWILPLWQKEFIEFWQKVPSEYRRDRKLYIDVLNEQFFIPFGIDFKPKGFDARFTSNSLSSRVRYLLPKGIKNMAKKLLIPKSEREINNLNLFAHQLGEGIGLETSAENVVVNEVMGLYLKNILLKFKREG